MFSICFSVNLSLSLNLLTLHAVMRLNASVSNASRSGSFDYFSSRRTINNQTSQLLPCKRRWRRLLYDDSKGSLTQILMTKATEAWRCPLTSSHPIFHQLCPLKPYSSLCLMVQISMSHLPLWWAGVLDDKTVLDYAISKFLSQTSLTFIKKVIHSSKATSESSPFRLFFVIFNKVFQSLT